MKALLASGAQVDVQDAEGMSALMKAVAFGHTAVLKALMSADANVNLKDSGKLTALHHAVIVGALFAILPSGSRGGIWSNPICQGMLVWKRRYRQVTLAGGSKHLSTCAEHDGP